MVDSIPANASKALIISSKQEKLEEELAKINNLDYEIFDKNKQNIIKNFYPELGNDRVAKLIACKKLYPNQNIALFDFGTALTLSLIDQDGFFKGGYVVLGYKTSLKALSHYCSALPDLSIENNSSAAHEAIIEGNKIVFESTINAFKEHARKALGDCVYLACGGNAEKFKEFFDQVIDEAKIFNSLNH